MWGVATRLTCLFVTPSASRSGLDGGPETVLVLARQRCVHVARNDAHAILVAEEVDVKRGLGAAVGAPRRESIVEKSLVLGITRAHRKERCVELARRAGRIACRWLVVEQAREGCRALLLERGLARERRIRMNRSSAVA